MNYLCGVRERRRGSAVANVLRINFFIRMPGFTQSSQLELGMEGYLLAIYIYLKLKRELRIEI
jgi:hypothetical protein